MSKNKKIVISIILILLVISIVVLAIVLKDSNDLNSNYEGEGIENFYGHNRVFYAEITKVSDKYILVDGTDINDINYQGEFELSIGKSTKIIKDEQEIKVEDLKIGDYVEIEFYGNIAETYPAKIKDVSEIKFLSNQEYKEKESELKDEASLIYNFYTQEITAKYKILTEIGADYSSQDAIQDNCFVVIRTNKIYNENLYTEFMQKYQNKEFAFIRLVKTTIEGDPIIYDIKYDNVTNKIVVIYDNTRDEFASEENKVRTIDEYENISEYHYNEKTYLVAYNGELNDEKFSTGELMIIAILN